MLVCKRYIKICVPPFCSALDLEKYVYLFYSRNILALLTGKGGCAFSKSKSKDQSPWLLISQLPKSSTTNQGKTVFLRGLSTGERKQIPYFNVPWDLSTCFKALFQMLEVRELPSDQGSCAYVLKWLFGIEKLG